MRFLAAVLASMAVLASPVLAGQVTIKDGVVVTASDTAVIVNAPGALSNSKQMHSMALGGTSAVDGADLYLADAALSGSLKQYYGYKLTGTVDTDPFRIKGHFEYFGTNTNPSTAAANAAAWVSTLTPLHTAGVATYGVNGQFASSGAAYATTKKLGLVTPLYVTGNDADANDLYAQPCSTDSTNCITALNIHTSHGAGVDQQYNPATGWPEHVALVGGNPVGTRYEWLVTKFVLGAADVHPGSTFVTGLSGANGDSTGQGDPQFSGLQGQDYQFHGMADEVFNLVSTPELQMNSLFKFIASGNCQYNNTVCWSHPGTYLGQIAVQFGSEQILLQSGSHSAGMTVLVNGKVIAPSTHAHRYHSNNSTMSLSYKSATGEVSIATDKLYFRIVNSDYFFNLDFGVKDRSVILAGAPKLTITGDVCERESHSVIKTLAGKVAEQIKAIYPDVPMHGLLGQTWRNAVYCGRYFEGIVDDYVTGGLFSNEFTFNQFQKL